jgi:hypothetical protein
MPPQVGAVSVVVGHPDSLTPLPRAAREGAYPPSRTVTQAADHGRHLTTNARFQRRASEDSS